MSSLGTSNFTLFKSFRPRAIQNSNHFLEQMRLLDGIKLLPHGMG